MGRKKRTLTTTRRCRGGIDEHSILVEFTVRSIDAAVHHREAVRQYELNGDRFVRVGPFALSPRDFVDEWLTHRWDETAAWSDAAGRDALAKWHTRLHRDFVAGDFIDPTMHCESPDLWQVGVDLSELSKPSVGNIGETWFLVRWEPPYRFTMVSVSDRPSPACQQDDGPADEERSLFPERR